MDVNEISYECFPVWYNEVIIKAGVNLNGIFVPLKTGLVQISRSHFKQFKNSMLKT